MYLCKGKINIETNEMAHQSMSNNYSTQFICAMFFCVFSTSAIAQNWSYPTESIQRLPYEYGMGTEEAPYVITNAQQLADLSWYVNNGTTYENSFFKLGNDIDLNPSVTFNPDFTITSADGKEPQQWIPIGFGKSGQKFAGNFDGAGHKIYGLYPKTVVGERYYNYAATGSNDPFYACGLFGVVLNSKISNLTIENSFIKIEAASLTENVFEANYIHIGMIAAAMNGGDMYNCTNNGHILVEKTNSSMTGGLVGFAQSWGNSPFNINNCENNGNLTYRGVPENEYYNTNVLGGIAGILQADNVSHLLNTGTIKNEQVVTDGHYGSANSCGGVMYECRADRISYITNKGEIYNGSGLFASCTADSLTNSYNTGVVTNGCGIAHTAYLNVMKECYNNGNIQANDEYSDYIAGLIEKLMYGNYYVTLPDYYMEKCWNTGAVKHANGYAAGLVAQFKRHLYDDKETDWVLKECFNIGSVTSDGAGSNVGGLTIWGPMKIYDCYNAGKLSADITYALCCTVKEIDRCFNYEAKKYRYETDGMGLYNKFDCLFDDYYNATVNKIYYLSSDEDSESTNDKYGMGTAMTSTDFANGHVLALLREGVQDSPWYQDINDRYPKLNDADNNASSISDVTVDKSALTGRIFNLQGHYVGSDLNALPTGIYILNGKKILVR